MGIEKNVYWTERAQQVDFDAARVNNIPALDNDARMARNIAEFANGPDGGALPTPPSAPPPPLPQTYVIPGGTVAAVTQDSNALVGRTVSVYDNFWAGYENSAGRTPCPVIARCQREFRHPDGTRCLTYLIEYDERYWPITHAALLNCLPRQVRAALPPQRGL